MPPAQAQGQAQAPDSLVNRAKSLALQLQFLWFVGHLITGLLARAAALSYPSTRVVVQAIFAFLGSGIWSYYKAYYGTIIR